MNEPTDPSTLLIIDVPDTMQPIVRYLAVGDSSDYEDQLIIKSKQPHILKYTPNDAGKRFVDKASLKEWLDCGHTMHWLLSETYDLAGIIWYRKKTLPKEVHIEEKPSETFAIRLYEGYVGHHLSIPFMKLSLKTAIRLKLESQQKIEGMWLETTAGNEAAIASYVKFGYTEVYRDKSKVIMTMDAQQLIKIADEVI